MQEPLQIESKGGWSDLLDRPLRPIALLGVWLLFFPVAAFLVFNIAGMLRRPITRVSVLVLVVMAFGVAMLATVLARITRHYAASRRHVTGRGTRS